MAMLSDGEITVSTQSKMGQKKRLKWWKFNWKPVHTDFISPIINTMYTEINYIIST